jgi:hypothetical protein
MAHVDSGMAGIEEKDPANDRNVAATLEREEATTLPPDSVELPTIEHPHNWPAWIKWVCIVVVAYCDALT